MLKCGFIGHRDSFGIEDKVYSEIRKLMESGIREFYSGGMGNFDKICERAVKELGGKIVFVPYNLKAVKSEDIEWYDEIICPSYTFFATNTAILFTGATPVLVDCDEYGNIDYLEIEKKINARTKAIVVTHMWGYPCRMDKLREIADKYNIFLLEDCSHAHGGSLHGKKMGEWGDVAIFSLQGQKIITGGEGGVLITNNKRIFDKALLLGHYNKRCKQELDKNGLYKYATTGKGMKLRAHPLAIRLAYEQFKNLDKMNSIKNKYALKIMSSLEGVKGLEILTPLEGAINSWYALIIKYHPELMCGVSREVFVNALHAEGAIEVDIPNSTCPVNYLDLFQYPDLLYPNYKGKIHYTKDDFPNATRFYDNIIKLPVWYTESDEYIVEKYIKAIKKVCKNIKELI